jgi:hypothetical protein
MTLLFEKLNYKNQQIIHLLNAPASLHYEIETMSKILSVKQDVLSKVEIEF